MQPRIFGDYSAIRRDYSVDEYMADAQPHGVVKSVYVQVNVAAGEEVKEVAWAQSVGEACGFPHAIVGYADLCAPDVAVTLDQERTHPRLRGIRQQLHWHENPRYRFAVRPDVMNDSSFRAGMQALAARELLFELQVFPRQMRDAARLAHDFPDVSFVLLHAGMLEDRSAQGRKQWCDCMRSLAAAPNVYVKLSGLGTFVRACSVALWKPVIDETIDLFGPSRCLFGSNFPIEKLWTPYGEIVSVVKTCLADLSQQDRRAVLYDNARRLYRL
jgi:predicted TIM-barrel fold metal-dependent hydrolase